MSIHSTRSTIIGFLLILVVAIAPRPTWAEQITVTNPHSGDIWYLGLLGKITWVKEGVHQPVNVDLMQGSTVITKVINHPLPDKKGENFGEHEWQVKPDIPSGFYRIRVQTADQKTTGLSEQFQIIAPKISPPSTGRIGLPGTADGKFGLSWGVLIDEVSDLAKIWSTQCKNFAKWKVFEQALNTNYQCGLKGPEWNSDYQFHYDWCMQQHYSQQPEQIAARNSEMTKLINACNSYIAVRVTLTKLDVHDDCDNVSKGDWYVALASTGTTPKSGSHFNVWPGRTSAAHVDGGSSYNPGIENVLILQGTSNLRVKVGAVDCDGSPGHWFWPAVFGVPIPPVGSSMWPYESSLAENVDCDGEEEVFEFSGANDFLGYEVQELTPQQWQAGANFKLIAGKNAVQACGSSGPPYTAHISVQRVFPKP